MGGCADQAQRAEQALVVQRLERECLVYDEEGQPGAASWWSKGASTVQGTNPKVNLPSQRHKVI